MRSSKVWFALALGLWLTSSVQAQDALVLDYQSNGLTGQQAAALAQGGALTVTVVVDDVGFAAALPTPPSGIWDVVVVDNPCHAMTISSPLLVDYINSGAGALVVNYWNLDTDPALQAALGLGSATDFFTAMELWDWGGSVYWTGVTNPIPLDGTIAWNDNGDRLTTSTGLALGGFTPATTAGEAGVVFNNTTGMNTVVVGQEYDSMVDADAIQFLTNIIDEVVVMLDCLPVAGLSCTWDCDTGETTISWGLPSTVFDSIEVLQDGTPVPGSPFSGDTTEYVDTLAPGTYTFAVTGDCSTGTIFTASCTIDVVVGSQPDNVIWAAELPSQIDSVAAIEAALTNLGEDFATFSDLVSIPCLTPDSRIWVATGSFPDNHPLTDDEGQFLVDHVSAGGHLYFEGGDTWGFDAQTVFETVDGIENGTALDGDDSFLSMDGQDFGDAAMATFSGTAYNQDQAGTDWTDQIQATALDTAGPSSGVIWQQAGGAYNTGVFYDTDPGFGKLICQSWEFGGFDGSQDDLANAILLALGGGTPPVCLPVSMLACTADCSTSEVSMTWQNNDTYTDIEIELDGTLIDTLAGSATSFSHTPADGDHTYTVRAICTAGPASDRNCDVSVGLVPNYIVALELPALTDSVAALQAAMDGAGMTYQTVFSFGDIGCTDSSVTVWVQLGSFPSNHPLTAGEGTQLLGLITGGTSVYLEGGDTWGFDAQTDFALVDGIEDGTASDGDDTFIGMIGSDFGAALLAGMDAAYTQDQVGNDWTDQIFAAAFDTIGPNSGVIWMDDMTGGGFGYNTGVFYDTDPGNGKVISQSWEFGGYGGVQGDLLDRYVAALGGAVTPTDDFKRGDANNDNGYDISDAVFTLSELFVPGSPASNCNDASDANDDGGKDISDAVYTLSALFVPGSPAPPAPGPMTCGPDPTMDALDCAGYLHCP